MGSKPKSRFKITCLEYGVPMNNDHRTKHNLLFHAEMLKQHKVIRWETLNAPKNPFEARPTKVPRTEEAPSTSTNTTSVPDSIATVNDRLSCDSANMKQPPPSSAETRGKQISASEKPTTVSEKPCQPRDSRCFLDSGKNSRVFGPSWFDHDEWKTWLHYDQNKDAAFCFTCIKAVEQNLISSKNVEEAFICAGYKNWGVCYNKWKKVRQEKSIGCSHGNTSTTSHHPATM